jgi:[protein-PII] uridylyltransferase
MLTRLSIHARDRLLFPETATKAERVSACKRFLKLELELAHRKHRGGASGKQVAGLISDVMDHVLKALFEHAIRVHQAAYGTLPVPVALVALGGYGRSELCPRSDVDIMFLFPARTKDTVIKSLGATLTDEVLYVLWDCKLKVGHSTRTIDEVFEEARAEIQSKTALLDARRIAGSETLFSTFEKSYSAFVQNESPGAYIQSRLKDQRSRREKYGGTVFMQEPDIKNGVGGLRDYQNGLWMAKVKLGVSSFQELAEKRYLLERECRELDAAYDYLLRVRNDLHFNSKHATDLLTLEVQGIVAERIGYRERQDLRRIELFMRDYYSHARNIYRITSLVEERLSLATADETATFSLKDVLLARRKQRLKRFDGFVLRGHELAYETRSVFHEDPKRLIRVFRHLQQLEAEPDFELGNLIRESLPLITRPVINSAEANLAFRAILESPGQVHPILSLMHEFGVLGKFLPEFGKLTCLVQHEFYHRYTADIHTLNTIRQLDCVFQAEDPLTQKYAHELRSTPNPTILYVTLLLHDLGKAISIAKHDVIGVRIAGPILKRLRYDEQSSDLALFLIKNHLQMARFWQKFDIDDPQAITVFSNLVGDVERLRLLYVHTFCDARGTAVDLWNGYKDALHTSLLKASADRLSLSKGVELRDADRKNMIQQGFKEQVIPGLSAEEVDAHFSLLPDRYFVHTTPEEMTLHMRMVQQLMSRIATASSMGTLEPVIDWQDDVNRSLTVVNVVTWDRAGLFYRLAGAFSVAGLNILGARIFTRGDHIALDTFHVVDPSKGIVQDPKSMAVFKKHVDDALVHNRDLYPEIVSQARKFKSSWFSSERPVAHNFTPHVDVYHELSLKRTILEIQAPDQIGLLYRISKAIFDHGYDITFARINTERGMAVDTFYIEPSQKHQSRSTEDLLHLREAIARIIDSGEEVQAA